MAHIVAMRHVTKAKVDEIFTAIKKLLKKGKPAFEEDIKPEIKSFTADANNNEYSCTLKNMQKSYKVISNVPVYGRGFD